MKAGILTFHEADNYGAVLQAYALQTALARMGVESEFVSFEPEAQAAAASAAGDQRAALFANRIRAEGEKRATLFAGFRSAYLKCSAPFSRQDTEGLDRAYDLFIAGSDQIWNPHIPGADARYFLPFAAPEKRFSYAASFGAESFPEKAKDWCARQLGCFHALSVREERGREIVKELTGRDSAVCLDPTLLVDRAEWEKLTGEADGEAYALLFLFKYDEPLTVRAQSFARRKGLKLRTVTAAFMPQFGFSSWSGVGVQDWLSLIAHAECVFTNSFHGVVFSMIFGRPFSAAYPGGELSDRNGRIAELLKNTGMEPCLNGEPDAISAEALARRLNALKQASFDYLKKAVAYGKMV